MGGAALAIDESGGGEEECADTEAGHFCAGRVLGADPVEEGLVPAHLFKEVSLDGGDDDEVGLGGVGDVEIWLDLEGAAVKVQVWLGADEVDGEEGRSAGVLVLVKAVGGLEDLIRTDNAAEDRCAKGHDDTYLLHGMKLHLRLVTINPSRAR